jgi:hypothetical protein
MVLLEVEDDGKKRLKDGSHEKDFPEFVRD